MARAISSTECPKTAVWSRLTGVSTAATGWSNTSVASPRPPRPHSITHRSVFSRANQVIAMVVSSSNSDSSPPPPWREPGRKFSGQGGESRFRNGIGVDLDGIPHPRHGRRGEQAGFQAVRRRHRLDHPCRRTLAVGAGDVDYPELVLGPAQEKAPLHPGKAGLHSPRLQRVDIGQGFGVGHNRPLRLSHSILPVYHIFPREKGSGERADTSSVKNPGGDLPSSMKGPA